MCSTIYRNAMRYTETEKGWLFQTFQAGKSYVDVS